MVEHIYLAYTKLLLKKKQEEERILRACIWEVETGYQEFKVSLTTD